jgi:hypothetical protein
MFGDQNIQFDIQSLSIHFCCSLALIRKLQLLTMQFTSTHSVTHRLDGHCSKPVVPNCRLLEHSSLLALTLRPENISYLEAKVEHQFIVQISLPEYCFFFNTLLCWCVDDLWKIPVDTQIGPSSELASATFVSSSSAETTKFTTMFASSRSNTAQTLSESAQSTNQIEYFSTASVGSETAQKRESSHVALVLSSTSNSQFNTLTYPKSSASKVENSSSFTTFFQTNQYYLVALGSVLLVLTCCLCYFYRRWRQRKRTTSQFTNSTLKAPSTKSNTSKQTTSSLYSTTSYTTSMSNTSSNQTSEYSQDQTMSLTLASKELGILMPFF